MMVLYDWEYGTFLVLPPVFWSAEAERGAGTWDGFGCGQ